MHTTFLNSATSSLGLVFLGTGQSGLVSITHCTRVGPAVPLGCESAIAIRFLTWDPKVVSSSYLNIAFLKMVY